jgi:predicted metal-binding protein
VDSLVAGPGGAAGREDGTAAVARLAESLGASATRECDVSDIVFRMEFRGLCEANRCGSYGKGWMCPPACGELGDLIADCRTRSKALVFTSIGRLSSKFDYRGMMAASEAFSKLVQALAKAAPEALPEKAPRVLGAGPCRVCRRCAYQDGEPCRHPESAVMSLEANGVDVSQLAKLTGLAYNNGPETVTYFGAVLFNP